MAVQIQVRVARSMGWQQGLGAGMSAALLVLSGGGMAAPAMAQVSSGDVVVPTEPAGGNTGGNTGGSTGGNTGGNTGGVLTGTRFICQTNNGQPTVMYNPESQPGQLYAWAVPGRMGGSWSPERRCGEIARRLESYRPDGLVEMRTQVENGLNTICVTTQNTPSCRIVLTVPPGQDPLATRDRVFENLTIADSGQQTQGVNTFAGGGQDQLLGQLGSLLNINTGGLLSNSGNSSGSGSGLFSTRSSAGLNLRPFLDRKDGGTGERLANTTSRSTTRSTRVKPRIFQR